MNEINASRRLKEAAAHKAEADKTKQVKGAEGTSVDAFLPRMALSVVTHNSFEFLFARIY